MRRIAGRIDFDAVTIHHAIAVFAHAIFTNQSLGAFVIARTAVIDIVARIYGAPRTIGCTDTGYACVVLANQAIGTFIVTATATVDCTHNHFLTIAVGVAVAYLALSIVANQAVITAVAAAAAVVKLIQRVMQITATDCTSKTTAARTSLAAGTFDSMRTAIERIVWLAPVSAFVVLGEVVVAFAGAGDACAIFASAVIPPFVRGTINRFLATGF